MIALLQFAFFAAALGAAYLFWVRPILRSRPAFASFYAQAESFWAALRERFAGICAACHGPDGKGNPAMGAPDLTDDYWLYGGDYASIRASIAHGRQGNMPAHEPLIGRTRARLVAAWVYAQSHPEEPAPR